MQQYIVDEFILAFEDARTQDPHVDLSDFLPKKDHPHYFQVLREIVRVDMELGWGGENQVSLREYRQRFPELFEDPETTQELAFEEYRLRKQRGEDPTTEEYKRDFGVSLVIHTPRPELAAEDVLVEHGIPISVQMEFVAAAYQEHSSGSDEIEATQKNTFPENWVLPEGEEAPAQVFAQLHEKDPGMARRLAQGLTSMPEVGDEFAGFRLIGEIGKGAFGRVFLAHQGELANRPVVLKIAPDAGGESQTLAQMQHTHIVPIYSYHRARGLQAVCMPFLGHVTLADILKVLGDRHTLPNVGLPLFTQAAELTHRGSLPVTVVTNETKSEMQVAEESLKISKPQTVPKPLKRLQHLSYVDAVLWIGACLAEGLAHAHDRGILHRDLKPANILLTDDGVPMLLDFNLSEDLKLRGNAPAAMVGGTLPYMAPEHLRAFRGEDTQADERSDVYSLGLILYELMTKRLAFPSKRKEKLTLAERLKRMIVQRSNKPTPPRKFNPKISPATSAILAKALHPDPNQRYQTAQAFHEDLTRQLESKPLKHAGNPSVRERVQKWARRNPKAPARLIVLTLVLIFGVAGFWGVRTYRETKRQEQLAEAKAARLAQFEAARDNYKLWKSKAPYAEFLLYTQIDRPDKRQEGIQRTEEALSLFNVLADREWFGQMKVTALETGQQAQLRRRVGEMLIMLVQAKMLELESKKLTREEQALRLRELIALNSQATSCFAKGTIPSALWSQQAQLLEQADGPEAAKEYVAKAKKQPLKTSSDYYFAGRAAYVRAIAAQNRRDLKEFQRQLNQAVDYGRQSTVKDIKNLWAWFLLGNCYDLQSNHQEAIHSYSLCIALDPRLHFAHFQRGVAHLRQKNYTAAVKDLDKAIECKSDFDDAYFNRGLARQHLDQHKEAISDFDRFLDTNPGKTRAYFCRAKSRFRVGDQQGARADREKAMSQNPVDVLSWIERGMARLDAKDFQGALEDLDQALKLDPFSRPALRNKAYILSEKLKRTEDAIRVLDKVVEAHPDFIISRAERGVLLARAGHRERALKDATVSREKDPRPEIFYFVGCIYSLTSIDVPEDRIIAFRMLRDAVVGGWGASYIRTDPDLAPLRQYPTEFKRLADLARRVQQKR